MEVVAASRAQPTEQIIRGMKLRTSIVHDPLTLQSNYIGISPAFIHSESFAMSGAILGDLRLATVRFTKSKKVAVWKKSNPVTLLELAESSGLTPDFDCRVGACGSCAVKLTCGSVSGGLQMDVTVLTCSAMPATEQIELDI